MISRQTLLSTATNFLERTEVAVETNTKDVVSVLLKSCQMSANTGGLTCSLDLVVQANERYRFLLNKNQFLEVLDMDAVLGELRDIGLSVELIPKMARSNDARIKVSWE